MQALFRIFLPTALWMKNSLFSPFQNPPMSCTSATGNSRVFCAATGASFDDLSTWDDFFRTAEKYYEYSGKPFCAFDYLLRAVELNATEKGAKPEELYLDGYYDFESAMLKASYMAVCRGTRQGTHYGSGAVFQHPRHNG